MRRIHPSTLRNLSRLKNIAWLRARQLGKLSRTLTVSGFDRRTVIFDERHVPESVHLLLSGVARITCRDRRGKRTMVLMVAPGMIPSFPLPLVGVTYGFRCEAVTNCQIGTIDFDKFIEISLGIASADFKRMAANYVGRWDLVQLRCSNFMNYSFKERVALILLELGEDFGVRHALATVIRRLKTSGIRGSADNGTGIVTTAGDGSAPEVTSGIKGSAGIGIRRATLTGNGEPTQRNVGAGRARTRIVSIGNTTTIKITTMVPETANAATTEKTSAATLRHSGGGSPMAYLS